MNNSMYWMTKSNAEIWTCKIVESLFILQMDKAQTFAMVTKTAKKN